MAQAKQATLEGYRQHANNVTPPLSRAFGSAAENFNNTAAKALDSTRVVVDGLTSMTRTVIITATIVGLLILLFTDRYGGDTGKTAGSYPSAVPSDCAGRSQPAD